MFAAAYSQAASFTQPVIISHVRADNEAFAGIGSFVVVNEEGWILTSAHILDRFTKLAAEKRGFEDHAKAVTAIEADGSLLSDQKKKRIKALKQRLSPDAAVNFSFWWAHDGVAVTHAQVLKDADLAVARLSNWDPAWVTSYPTFKDPMKPIASGTSLCRLGFPFHNVKPTYSAGVFTLPPGTFPVVFFPNEGILTRVLEVSKGGQSYAGFIETSSPGLRGQSGGPIFDQHGTVWGIQSHTSNLPLGFSPPVPGKPGQVEHQFLNVGRGSHPASIVGLLNQAGVKHTISAY